MNHPSIVKYKENYINITGQQFGDLKAIKYVGSNKKGQPLWLFRCKCGNEKIIFLANVKRGLTKSCGCLRHTQSKDYYNGLIGVKFNKLTILEFKGYNNDGCATFLCRCDCGNEKILSGSQVKCGKVKSCGCIKKDIAENRHQYLIGRRFGRLIVESISNGKPSKRNDRYYNCICDCGNKRLVRSQSLTSGHSKSCGCLNKEKNQFKKKEGTPLNSLFYGYIRSARDRFFSFELTKEEFAELIKQNCFYCGSKPRTLYPSYTDEILYYNGIDRVNPMIGYIKGNVVSCCSICNYGKRNMNLNEFRIWIEKVYKHLLLK